MRTIVIWRRSLYYISDGLFNIQFDDRSACVACKPQAFLQVCATARQAHTR